MHIKNNLRTKLEGNLKKKALNNEKFSKYFYDEYSETNEISHSLRGTSQVQRPIITIIVLEALVEILKNWFNKALLAFASKNFHNKITCFNPITTARNFQIYVFPIVEKENESLNFLHKDFCAPSIIDKLYIYVSYIG